jgi:DNA-binding CsgD family transcriptional regulator
MKEVESTTAYRYKWKGINLNKWEHEILELLIEGLSYQEICSRHLITFDTFFSLIRSVYAKLQKHRGNDIANEFLYRVTIQAGRINTVNTEQESNIHINRHSMFSVFYNE